MNNRILIAAAVLVLLGAVAGYTLKGCMTPRPATPTTTVVRDTVRYDVDSIRAEIRAEFKGQPARLITRTVTVRDTVTDDALALSLYAMIDSLVAAQDSALDIVATGYTRTDTYELSQAYSLRRREFAHALKIVHSDTTTSVTCPDPPSFWDLVQSYGLTGTIGAILGMLLTRLR